jgi:hypothetical protein
MGHLLHGGAAIPLDVVAMRRENSPRKGHDFQDG